VIRPDRIAITGIGATEQGEIPGQTANEIALRAAVAAIADAGIDKSAIDGLVTCQPPLSAERAGLDEDMGQLLGINPSFSSTLQYGACGFSLHLAAMAIASGMATTVLLTYGTNQRSAKASFSVPIGGGATSVWVLQQLEQYGFCKEGEAGPFVAEGHTRPGGSLPVNTHGGQLSESYTWNWMDLYEAVRQLRGECGDRQVPGTRLALHAQTHDFFKGAATILSTEASA
jgi:acetyl-CoA acetyltransferase